MAKRKRNRAKVRHWQKHAHDVKYKGQRDVLRHTGCGRDVYESVGDCKVTNKVYSVTCARCKATKPFRLARKLRDFGYGT